MKKLLMIFPLVILLCFTFGCQKQAEKAKPEVDTEADIAAIKAYFDQLSSSIEAGDVGRWIALFADDIIKMPPNEAIVKGKEAVRQWGQPWFDNLNMEDSISIDEIEVSGNWAFARVTVTFKAIPKAGGDTIQDNSKAIWIFKRQADGSWKCSHHIWNSNNPPPPLPKEE